MRNFLFLACIVFLLAGIALAQTANKKNTSQAKTTTKSATTAATPATNTNAGSAAKLPSLSTKEPSFAGFTGSFIKFGKVSGSGRSFTMLVEYKPWFVEVKGTADASHNTEDLDVLTEDIIGVLAYYDSQGKAADGTDYQAGIFDFMMYLDDEPVNISNLSFTLLDKAASGSATLTQAKTWNFEQGRVFKTQKYSNDVIKAQAGAMDKSDILREQSAAKKRVSDSIAREKKRVSDSVAKAEKRISDSIERTEKRRRDSISKEKRRVRDSIAEVEEAKEKARRKAAQKKRRAAIEEDEDDEDYEPPAKKKKAASTKASAKKKRPVVEDDEDDEDEPPVKKKKSSTSTKKKRPVVEDDDD